MTDIDHAVDLLVEMKTMSEVAVDFAYASLLLDDHGLAGEVHDLAGRLDDMKHQLQSWVLRAAVTDLDPARLQALLQLSQAAEDLGDRAEEMVRPLGEKRSVHPVLALALGETDEVAVRVPVARGSEADSSTLRELKHGTGFQVLAVRRRGHYRYRPSGDLRLRRGDDVLAIGPNEARGLFTARCGCRLVDADAAHGERLVPLPPLGDADS